MKKQLVRVICLCLALVITMGSVGIAATEQICQMAGLQKAPAGVITDTCCAKTTPGKPVKAKVESGTKCCSISTRHYKLDTPATEKPFSVNMLILLPVRSEVAFQWNGMLPSDQVPTLDKNKSPPLFGIELLKYLHDFRI